MAVVKRRPLPKMNEEQRENFKKTLDEERRREQMHGQAVEKEMEHEEVQEVQEVDRLDNKEEKEVITDNTQEINKNYNLEMFQPASSKTISRSNLKAGAMSVVNSNCGKRITISKEVMDKLNNPSEIAISFSDERIAVGEYLPNNNNQLTLKMVGKKGVIYSAGLVTEITEKYQLDFSNRTSITFSEVDYIEDNGSTIAIINAKQV